MKDRFTEASAELADKNPYICVGCEKTFGHATIEHIGGEPDADRRREATDCVIFCDPMPFGD